MKTRWVLLKKALPWLPDNKETQKLAKVQIMGDKISLREKRLEDFPDDYAWRTDDELSRLDATRPIRMSYKEYLRYAREEIEHVGTSSRRLAVDTLNGRHIGNCMYYDINPREGEAELGIMIGDRDYWGKGYGTDAVTALLGHIFTKTHLSRVYLHTLDWNHRAQRSFEKAGFRQVKTVSRSGQDFILMEVHKDDWESHIEASATERGKKGGPRIGPAGPATVPGTLS